MKKILIAEDDTFLGKAYEAKLTKAGYDIKLVRDGVEVLDQIDEFNPDVIILDLIMPELDGFATLGEIRKNKSFKNTPIIIASNLGQKEDIDKGKEMGATDYIIKSDLSMNELITKINTLIQ